MKAIIKLGILSFFLLIISSCNNKDEINLNVSAVNTLYEPTDGKSVVLQSSASATLYFEWEPALAEDGGMVLYENKWIELTFSRI